MDFGGDGGFGDGGDGGHDGGGNHHNGGHHGGGHFGDDDIFYSGGDENSRGNGKNGKPTPLSKTARYILGSLGGLAAIDGARRIYCALSSSKEAEKPIDLGSVVVGGVEVIGGGFAAYEMFKNPASAGKSLAK